MGAAMGAVWPPLRDLLPLQQAIQERLKNHRLQRKLREGQELIELLRQEKTALAQLADRDAGTGALNRRGAVEAFKHLARWHERKAEPCALVMLDLDDFKRINEVWGHSAGDDVLYWLVQCFQCATRPDDVIVRWGGEEFVLLLPGTDASVAVTVVQRLRENFERTALNTPWCSFSAGLTNIEPHTSPETWILQADAALGAAKQQGKRCSRLYAGASTLARRLTAERNQACVFP